jgi:3-isopropylmalate/(R)-2-methylmalate dehydratase small subunit
MEAFTKLESTAVVLDIAKIDTGMILPGRFMRMPRRPGEATYANAFLHDLRFDADGEPRADCVLNAPVQRAARILITAADFGCGSSREGAAYATLDYGFRALIGPSFGDIYYANCLQNGLLPVVLAEAEVEALRQQVRANPNAVVTIDLEAQTVSMDVLKLAFAIDESRKQRLLAGLDDIGVTLQHLPAIEAYEQRHYAGMDWFRHRVER